MPQSSRPSSCPTHLFLHQFPEDIHSYESRQRTLTILTQIWMYNLNKRIWTVPCVSFMSRYKINNIANLVKRCILFCRWELWLQVEKLKKKETCWQTDAQVQISVQLPMKYTVLFKFTNYIVRFASINTSVNHVTPQSHIAVGNSFTETSVTLIFSL